MSTVSSTSSIAGALFGGGALRVNGLVTGLDTDKIIEGLLAIQQRRIDVIQARQSAAQQQQTAYKGIEARLLALQSQLTQLARPQNGVFEARTVASSAPDLVTAAASAGAAPGAYQIRVGSLAQTHQVISQGFDSTASSITQGTFQIRVGNGATATVTIDSSNATLQGLADAINNAHGDVTATMVNDGSAANTQPYRLLLTSGKSGAANAIAVTNGLATDGSGAFRPVFDASYVGAADVGADYTGTSTPTANRGAGNFNGAANNTYQFTVISGGTVGTDNDLQIAFTDTSGTHTGVVTLNAGDADTMKSVAEGIQVQFAAGTLVAGQTFTVKGYVPQVQAAADATVTIGAGSGALTVNSATNQFDGLFPGLSLNLLDANPAKTITITVANDTAKIEQTVQDFIGGFNELMTFIDQQVQFDTANNTAGPLLGSRQATAVQDTVRDALTRPVAGLITQMSHLSALGITTDEQGQLTLNQAKLDDALTGKINSVSLDDVRRLFALGGVSSRTGIDFVTANSKTKSSATPYQVVVTSAADQASITAANALSATTVLDGTNNTFTIAVDSVISSTITLAPGTYSRLGLAQAVQAQINANANLGGRKVTVALTGDKLAITSSIYGTVSKIAIGSGTALSPLGFDGSETDQGQNVAGYFEVNGQQETATGSGQLLLGAGTNAHTAGLQVRSTLTAAQVGGGVSADMTVTRGVAAAVDLALGNLLDPVSGRMHNIDDGFQATIDDMQQEIARQSASMSARRDSLLQQFAALESTVSQLQSLGNYLANQFSQLPAIGSSNK